MRIQRCFAVLLSLTLGLASLSCMSERAAPSGNMVNEAVPEAKGKKDAAQQESAFRAAAPAGPSVADLSAEPAAAAPAAPGEMEQLRMDEPSEGHGVAGGVIGDLVVGPVNTPVPISAEERQKQFQALLTARARRPEPAADKNGWFQNTYAGGTGSRESLQQAVEQGVLVDGKQVKLAAFARAFQQTFPFPAKDALGVTVSTDRGKLLPEGGSVFVQVGLQAASRESAGHAPLNVAMVIDVSGSMGSENKLEFVKEAAQEVVSLLTPADRLGIIAYSDEASVRAPMALLTSKSRPQRVIASLNPESGTNIYGGLEAGVAELRKLPKGPGANLVLLLTDGQVTAGERDSARFEQLARKASGDGIEITTIGVGTDYNESLMMSLARAGGGNYHFLRSGEAVKSTMRTEIEELSKSVARDVRLRIELAPDVDLVRVLGSDQLSQAEAKAVKAQEQKIDKRIAEELGIAADRSPQDEPGIKMLLPTFKAKDAHVVILEVRVRPGKGVRSLGKVEIKYKDMLARKNGLALGDIRAEFARDRAESVASIDRKVKKNILGFQTGEALKAAADHLTQRRTPEAIKRIDDQLVLLGVAAREWKDADLERDALLLGQYKDTLVAYQRRGMSPELVAYLGKSFSYSAFQRLR